MNWLRALFAALALTLVPAARAQVPTTLDTAQRPLASRPLLAGPAPGLALPEPGSELSVRLLTVGMSDVLWERFGHNALWISDRSRGIDVAFNWGTFDFAQPNFLGRFLTGNTLYWMVGNDAQADIARYVDANRSVWVQELNLTPAQRLALLQFVEWTSQPEHRYYRYDYYLDNCSTRVRDALDSVLGGAIRRTLAPRLTGTTYRWHTRRLTEGDAPVYTGIQLALGRPADRDLSEWEESFLPVKFMQHVREVRVTQPDGSTAPLVLSERQLYASSRFNEPAAPTSHLIAYLLGGLALGGTLALLGNAASAGRRGAAAGFGVVAGVWTLVAGLAGTALLLAGTVTRHVFMGRNMNLAPFSPLVLLLLVLVLVAVGARRRAARVRWAGRASKLAGLLVALTALGLLVALGVGQRSGEIFALALPAHLGAWWGLRRMAEDRGAWPAPTDVA